jgi:hypothetical protein
MILLETLSILIHGNSKVGKTSLASTSPAPILVLDAEGGWKFLALRRVDWDPMQSAPPAYDGTWDVCHVTVRDWNTVGQVSAWLQSGRHQFRSLVIDSITELQRRLKENLVGTEQMKMQDWGSLLMKMDAVIRGMRDLTTHPTNPLQVVVFIAETRDSGKGKMIPSMQGQISTAMPYWMDLVGYLFVQDIVDANGQSTGQKVRRLLTTPNDDFEAGERVQGRLASVVDYPNITQMLIDVYPSLQQQVQ